ncbi:dsRBD fold-containing protein [Actinorugispora endophytica]|uniref:Uncharacterized protein DUF1918 n=1 Tax=Actinorugispora endophytica TaxID=1605990 RepID=A0A4R6UKH2_9ACTN|nr:dsRBD fold-containing protein [Actinorugispora endophytica]TDQ45979.1 uncharacterized protein DUF1918 [Actinorugispora endophytica]
MRARIGDRIIVERARDDMHRREGVVVSVQGPEGGPPYRVRWLEDGHEALVYPGPDAHIETGGVVPSARQESSEPGGYGELRPVHTMKRWTVDIVVTEEAEEDSVRTMAEATVAAKERAGLRGHGMARKHPSDTDVPEIGDELAVSRALSDLARKLRQTASEDITDHTGTPWQPT